MLDYPASITIWKIDSDLSAAGLTRPGQPLESVDILYLASHGYTSNSIYRFALHDADWSPATEGFGGLDPSVVVFDSCDLASPGNRGWIAQWASTTVSKRLRLVCGFSSPATVSEDSTQRGAAFATRIRCGDLIAQAWLVAVYGTAFQGLDKPVVLALGDDQRDAQRVLTTMRLGDLPSPRTNAVPSVAIWPR